MSESLVLGDIGNTKKLIHYRRKTTFCFPLSIGGGVYIKGLGVGKQMRKMNPFQNMQFTLFINLNA